MKPKIGALYSLFYCPSFTTLFPFCWMWDTLFPAFPPQTYRYFTWVASNLLFSFLYLLLLICFLYSSISPSLKNVGYYLLLLADRIYLFKEIKALGGFQALRDFGERLNIVPFIISKYPKCFKREDIWQKWRQVIEISLSLCSSSQFTVRNQHRPATIINISWGSSFSFIQTFPQSLPATPLWTQQRITTANKAKLTSDFITPPYNM